MNDDGDWIKVYRQMLDSRVFSDDFLFRLWMWCLLKANWKRGWKFGREIPPGSFATGEMSAAEQLGVSGSKWRRGMAKLIEFEMIRKESTNKFTLVSIVKWHKFQPERRTSDEPPTNHRRTTDEPPTTIEEGKKGRREEVFERDVSTATAEGELFGVIPPRFRTNRIEEAVLAWQQSRSEGDADRRRKIGLDAQTLKLQLMKLAHLSEARMFAVLADAASGGWKSLYEDTRSDAAGGRPATAKQHKPTTFQAQKTANTLDAINSFVANHESKADQNVIEGSVTDGVARIRD